MTDVVVELSMSLDGFIAGPGDDEAHALGTRGGEHVFDWYFSGAEPYPPGTMFKAEGANRAVVDEMYARYGAFVSGRRTYDLVGGWGGSHPVDGAALVILTSHPPSDSPSGKSPITFVSDGIETAVEQAQAAAAGKDVGMIGASPAQQALQAARRGRPPDHGVGTGRRPSCRMDLAARRPLRRGPSNARYRTPASREGDSLSDERISGTVQPARPRELQP